MWRRGSTRLPGPIGSGALVSNRSAFFAPRFSSIVVAVKLDYLNNQGRYELKAASKRGMKGTKTLERPQSERCHAAKIGTEKQA